MVSVWLSTKTGADRKKKPTEGPGNVQWLDPKNKVVPGNLAAAKKNNGAAIAFDSLAFLQKKNAWNVSSLLKRRDKVRPGGYTIERLTKGWKNPRNT